MGQSTPIAKSARQSARIERVSFKSGDDILAGTLHIPAGVNAAATAPGVVVTGAWTTVKEQMAGRYAREMAARGFIALAFDFRNWGESGGRRRFLENPTLKIEDINAAASYLGSRPEVTPRSVCGLAVCASSGYLIEAAAGNPAFRTLAFVAPWIHDPDLVTEVYGGASAVREFIEASREAERKFQETGEATAIPATGPKGSNSAMPGVPYYDDPKRGAIPEWANQFDVASWEPWLTFDAHPTASHVHQPVFMIHSEAAAIPRGAHKFFDSLPGRKTQTWLPDVTQFDFYDQEIPVNTAADSVAGHFRATLQTPQSLTVGDRIEIAECVTAMGLYADLRAWDRLEGLFLETVGVDYTSLFGGEPGTSSAAGLVQDWREELSPLDATQHLITNLQIAEGDDGVIVRSHVQARHVAGDQWWVLGATYTHGLVRTPQGWRISALTIHRLYEDGDRAVLEAPVRSRKTERRLST
jgi:fermentation-respiration switch protein FrsA (DUF1100 family)